MIFLLLAIIIVAMAIRAKAESKLTGWLLDKIKIASAAESLPWSLVYGVVMTESGGDPNAENMSDPSSGLMGVMPIIGRAFGGLKGTDTEVLKALKDPDINLKAGTKFMRHLQKRYGVIFKAVEWIQAYNLGETKFDKGVRNWAYGNKVWSNAQSVS